MNINPLETPPREETIIFGQIKRVKIIKDAQTKIKALIIEIGMAFTNYATGICRICTVKNHHSIQSHASMKSRDKNYHWEYGS